MARRPAFYIDHGQVVSKMYSFEWFSGFAVSQKQKSIESLHNAILKEDPGAKPLEISTKSKEEINAISSYNYFTDIEFNPEKSINTQARTVSLIKLILEEYGCLCDFSKDEFIQYHRGHVGSL